MHIVLVAFVFAAFAAHLMRGEWPRWCGTWPGSTPRSATGYSW
jgi:hypothetical protein